MEEWKEIASFDRYEISNLGKVRSLKSGEPKELKPRVNKHTGYLFVGFWHQGKHHDSTVHSLVALAFLGHPRGVIGTKTDCWQVNHRDGIKTNNQVNNLEWVKKLDNTKHAADLGLYHRKLTHQQAAEIKHLLDKQIPVLQIAKRYSVDPNTIYNIQKGKAFTYVKPVEEIQETVVKEKRKTPKEFSSLGAEKARAIRIALANGVEPCDLAREYNVAPTAIYNIRDGKSYKSVVI